MQCKEWDDANSELFKEPHDEAVHKNSYKSRLYELISASLRGNAYKVSVTGFTCSAIWHDNHSADWLATLAPLSGFVADLKKIFSKPLAISGIICYDNTVARNKRLGA